MEKYGSELRIWSSDFQHEQTKEDRVQMFKKLFELLAEGVLRKNFKGTFPKNFFQLTCPAADEQKIRT